MIDQQISNETTVGSIKTSAIEKTFTLEGKNGKNMV